MEMEYRILMRINCHKGQFNNLFKNSSSEFRRKNKYNEILPYMHNMVKLMCHFEDQDDKFRDYYNASFINVRFILNVFEIVIPRWANRRKDIYCCHGSNYKHS
jgi:protein tyrosine phosphatase